jgi:predicted RNA-binding Zn-ribbon protein involved in translation (DUF1610 family)
MPRATCRCGQELNIPDESTDRVVCPRCGSKVKVRLAGGNTTRPGAGGAGGGGAGPRVEDGLLRFLCPCGRRLKVSATNPPSHGKCPDCARIVPVPAESLIPVSSLNAQDPEYPTEELSTTDVANLERWAAPHLERDTPLRVPTRVEAGLRVCPQCGKPVHLGADTCRTCGVAVPRRS